MKSRLFFFLLMVSAGSHLFGQAASPEVLGSAGMHSTTTDAQVSWTVGELVTETYSSGSNTATQGFHQTQLTITALEQPLDDFQVEVFPNPASTFLNIRFGEPTSASLQMVDMHGRSVIEGPFNSEPERILDVSTLSEGSYVLRISGNAPGQILQFKIQVVHSN